jgi:hypothetical protein
MSIKTDHKMWGVNCVYYYLKCGNKIGSATDVIPQSLGIYDFDASLKKKSNGWKVTSAKWEQAVNDEPRGGWLLKKNKSD